MSLADHNQATKEKKSPQEQTGGLDWGINTRRTQTTQTTQTGRIGASTQSHNSTPEPTLPGLELAHATKTAKPKPAAHTEPSTLVVAENLQT